MKPPVGSPIIDFAALLFEGETEAQAIDAATRANEPITTRKISCLTASNAHEYDLFGFAVAISPDGATVAVGAPFEDSGALDSGAVYIFVRTDEEWHQEAYLKPAEARANACFGLSLAISNDGQTLAVGGGSSDQSAGAVSIYTRTGSQWSHQVRLTAPNSRVGDGFGMALALSSDGNTLAVGAPYESSEARGVNGGLHNAKAPESGAAYIYIRHDRVWSLQAYVKARNTDAGDYFGHSLALSADGHTLAVGAHGEASSASGVDGEQGDNSKVDSGAVYVFVRRESQWSPEAYIKATNPDAGDLFGASVALDADGSTLAVGAPHEGSSACGVNGVQGDNGASSAGAVYIYVRAGWSWIPAGYLKASNCQVRDGFGTAIGLSASGRKLVVGAPYECSNAIGLNGDQHNEAAPGSGAVYVFTRTEKSWSQLDYVKASNTRAGDVFGRGLSLGANGETLVVAAPYAHGRAGTPGATADGDRVPDSGAVYVYWKT